MDVLSINDLLPLDRKVKKIATGSELLLAYELDKYAKLMLGSRLSLSDVQIVKRVQGSEQFSFIVTNGLDIGFVPDHENLTNYASRQNLFFTKTVEGVEFKSKTEDAWTYNFSHNTYANREVYGASRSAAYVSLIAYMMVKARIEGVKCPKLIIDHESHAQLELEYVDLLILKNYGNKILSDLVEIKFSKNVKQQPDWEAFVMVNRQRGFMDKEYSTTEKFRYLKKNFQVGDVVLYYQRAKGAKGKTINKLTACYPAVIRAFDKNGIKISYYPLVETKVTRHIILSRLEDEYEGKVEYTDEDFNRYTVCNATISLTDIGVDMLTFTELSFILKPIDFDGSYQYFKTKNGYDNVWLSTLDTIYAVFEDRGVEYDKDRYLTLYFRPKNRIPVYDQYLAKR